MKTKDTRSHEEIRAHYRIEKQLATRLREAGRDERKQLYPRLYAELFESVPYFSARVSDTQGRLRKVSKQVQFLSRVLSSDQTFMDIGAGDCALAIELVRHVKKVYALDVVHQVNRDHPIPGNMELVITDGTSVDVPAQSVDIAFSNQLMEHLHPDDARDQLKNIHRALAPGGVYVVLTPHRFSGPHDISRNFDQVATGFHLKEYTNCELADLMKTVGFSRIKCYMKNGRRFVALPVSSAIALEHTIRWLPYGVRKKIAQTFPIKNLLGIRIVAQS